jgi:hypothetical protein
MSHPPAHTIAHEIKHNVHPILRTARARVNNLFLQGKRTWEHLGRDVNP